MSKAVDLVRVFIGYDHREEVAFHVLQRTIHERSSLPVSVTPISLTQLAGTFKRENNPLQSTEFSFSRFLVPWMCDFKGWAVFMDCDMIMREDIANLWALRDPRYAVQVVKHDYVPRDEIKFLNAVQTKYEKKNWSSVILFNCEQCKALTPEFVNTATGLELHQFKWLGDDTRIGELPAKWNHLVGELDPSPKAGLVHYTLGGPYFNEYRTCEFGDDWFHERDGLYSCIQRPLKK